MARRPLPSPSIPLVDAKTGLIQQAWFEYFQSRESVGMADLPDVTITTLANGDVLIWNETNAKFENGPN